MNQEIWKQFLTEAKEQALPVLREISEDELTHIERALDEMGAEDLAFNDLFDGKQRVVIDFKTLDVNSDLGKFVKELQDLGYDVDWKKGILSGERFVSNENPDATTNALLRTLGAGGGEEEPKKHRKVQMKIGKFFKKVSQLAKKQSAMDDGAWVMFRQWRLRDHGEEREEERPSWWSLSSVPVKDLKSFLDEKAYDDYWRTKSLLTLYLNDKNYHNYLSRDAGREGRAQRFGDYWQKNADYIKNNFDRAQTDQYSIIITRHPIDVLRMSDFEEITSCHSPPSRAHSAESYYKCAVAEAHGHGAVAYVVSTQELLDETGSESIEDAETNIQDGEVFTDDNRGIMAGGFVEPHSRVRLRQIRYYPQDVSEAPPKRWDEGTELALPESRVYGLHIPGLVDRIRTWARENQSAALDINALPGRMMQHGDGDIEKRVSLTNFMKFGGSYEDNAVNDLLRDFIDDPNISFEGTVRQNTETEDTLDVNLVGGLMEQWEEQCRNIAEVWNNRYQAVEVDYSVEDDGGEGAYIHLSAFIEVKWDGDEFVSLPGYQDAEWSVSELNDIGWGFLDPNNTQIRNRGTAGIQQSIAIRPAHIPDFGGQEYAYDPDMFEEFCVELNTIDDMLDGIKEYLERYYKREGHLAGAQFAAMARQIIDREISSYEWEIETDDPYEWEEVTRITADINFDFDPEELGIEPRVLSQILDSRDFSIAIRTKMHEPVQEQLSTEYFLKIEHTVADLGGTLRYGLEYIVSDYDPPVMTELFETMIETWDDEDEIQEMYMSVLTQMQNSRMPSGPEKELDETARYVKAWKTFLKR